MPVRIVWFEHTRGEEIWDTAAFTLYFEKPLDAKQRQQLVELIGAWFLLGEYGAFGGIMFGSSREVSFEDNIVDWTAEMERLPDPHAAVEALMRCLERFADNHKLGIEKLVLGGELIE